MRCVAIVPARRAEATIERTLESLRVGDGGFITRILVVTSSGDPTADMARRQRERDPRVEVVEAAAPLSAGAARNLGRAAARADLLLFIDADCWLEASGARALAAEMEQRSLTAVSARVRRDGGGMVARVRHALEFKEAEGHLAAPTSWLPPSTTMLCRADAFDRAGGFPDMWPGEDLVLMHRLRNAGGGVALSTAVSTWHLHPAGFREMLAHQRRLGRTSAMAKTRTTMRGEFFTRHRMLATFLAPARLLRILLWHMRAGRRDDVIVIALSPMIVAGIVSWTMGFVSGVPSTRRRGDVGHVSSRTDLASGNPPE